VTWVIWFVCILAVIGVMFLVTSVGLALTAWRKRSLVEATFALFLLVLISWFGYAFLVGYQNHPD
jgi:hypothetical protein